LSNKSYWEQFEATPEFVIMFIPGEAFYSAAVELAPQLFEEGVNQRVIIATPSNLIPLLLTVGYGWRQEAITANAQKIKELGNMLYDRVATMVRHIADMGSNLEKSVSSYNKLVGSMESRVLVTARKFKELGVTSKEELPELEVIDTVPRSLQTVERQALPDNSDSPE
jgi:DNA recombination protein RmuC